STAIASRLLKPQPEEKVLEACAAPGVKTGYNAQLIQDRVLIAACDQATDRIRVLEENLANLGAAARVFEVDWRHGHVPIKVASIGPFDRILFDAPCSNTGAMRRRVDVRWRLKPAHFISLQKQQLEIVRSLCSLLKPGG